MCHARAWFAACLLVSLAVARPEASELVVQKDLVVPQMAREEIRLEGGQTVSISARVRTPSFRMALRRWSDTRVTERPRRYAIILRPGSATTALAWAS